MKKKLRAVSFTSLVRQASKSSPKVLQLVTGGDSLFTQKLKINRCKIHLPQCLKLYIWIQWG